MNRAEWIKASLGPTGIDACEILVDWGIDQRRYKAELAALETAVKVERDIKEEEKLILLDEVAKNARLTAQIAALKAREKMVIQAMQRGTELYEATHRNTVSLPSYDKMACWLIERIATLEAEIAKLNMIVDECSCEKNTRQAGGGEGMSRCESIICHGLSIRKTKTRS